MRQDSDEWLEEKIDEDLMAWADAEERRIMEDEELQNVTMPEEKLEDIRRESAADAAKPVCSARPAAGC